MPSQEEQNGRFLHRPQQDYPAATVAEFCTAVLTEIEAVVQGTARDAAFDTLTASIGAAIVADRTLGGLCDWVEAEAPRPVDLPVEGAASLKAAVIPVVLHYSTADPLA
ncbi:hypothetical protein [Roseovarius tolerans]|uniref:hypothetical protein n=1 Tax=Roseovarius tolerans TaxID=74031 RepID=UPI00237DEFBA|nr:hypothetical protein [Roseovarius tolerans]